MSPVTAASEIFEGMYKAEKKLLLENKSLADISLNLQGRSP